MCLFYASTALFLLLDSIVQVEIWDYNTSSSDFFLPFRISSANLGHSVISIIGVTNPLGPALQSTTPAWYHYLSPKPVAGYATARKEEPNSAIWLN